MGEHVVTTIGDRVFPELRGGETITTLTYDCDRLRSIASARPTLFAATQVQILRSKDRVIALRGTDFAGGATIRLIYLAGGESFRVCTEVS